MSNPKESQDEEQQKKEKILKEKPEVQVHMYTRLFQGDLKSRKEARYPKEGDEIEIEREHPHIKI